MVDIPMRESKEFVKIISKIDKTVKSFRASIASEFTELVFDLLSFLPIALWINEIKKFEELTLVSSLSVWSNTSIQMFGRGIEEPAA